MSLDSASGRRSPGNIVLSSAVSAPTVSGSINLYPISATSSVSATLTEQATYRIATRSNGVMYALGNSSWTKAGHKAAYLPPDSWEMFWAPKGINVLSVTLVSGETSGTDVYVTQMLSDDLPSSGLLAYKLLGQP